MFGIIYILVANLTNTDMKKHLATLFALLALAGCDKDDTSKNDVQINVEPNSITAEVSAKDYLVTVTSNAAWVVDYNADWLTVTPTNGENNGTLTIKVAENTGEARTAKVTVTATGADGKEITVSQAAYEQEPIPPGTWAYSNIYHDPDKGQLTFATAPDSDKALYQGIFFQWGSLFGISPSDITTTEPYLVFSPSDFAGGRPSNYTDIPYMTEGSTDDRDFDQFETTYGNTGYNAAQGKGDICRYISDKGWVAGRWRMPTSNEIQDLYDAGNSIIGTWNDVSGTNPDGMAPISPGWNLGGGNNYRFFPAVGGRSTDGPLYNVGMRGYYWSASPGSKSNGAYSLHINSSDAYPAANNSRQCAFSVRCISE
jgi:uncharacterized protein (TIGR02145 family)